MHAQIRTSCILISVVYLLVKEALSNVLKHNLWKCEGAEYEHSYNVNLFMFILSEGTLTALWLSKMVSKLTILV